MSEETSPQLVAASSSLRYLCGLIVSQFGADVLTIHVGRTRLTYTAGSGRFEHEERGQTVDSASFGELRQTAELASASGKRIGTASLFGEGHRVPDDAERARF